MASALKISKSKRRSGRCEVRLGSRHGQDREFRHLQYGLYRHRFDRHHGHKSLPEFIVVVEKKRRHGTNASNSTMLFELGWTTCKLEVALMFVPRATSNTHFWVSRRIKHDGIFITKD